MRIYLKCSCGAEATWENDNATEAAITHTVDLSDSWHMSHAKCREAGREDAEDRRLASEVLNDPKETYTKFEPTLVGEDENWLHFRIQRKPGVIFTKAESMPDVYAKPPEPAKECEHMYPSNQGVPRCVRCGKEIGT